MKKAIIVVMCLTFAVALSAQNNKKVAVLGPICRDGSVNTFFAQIVRGTMENVISATDEYQAYDRTAFDKILEEHHFQRSGAVNDADIKQMGVMAGADFILVPEVSAYEGYLSVIVKILNVETGRYDKSANEIVEMNPPIVKKVCGEMAKKMFGVSDVSTGQRNGELQLSEGKYVGEYKDGKPHGKGIIYFKANDPYERLSYEGDWIDGKANGEGKMVWKDGEVYDGNWINDTRSGYGTSISSNGMKYEGNWSNDMFNGQGTLFHFDGSKVYAGGFKDGKIEGKGSQFYINGNKCYFGDWKDSVMCGYGVFYNEDGSIRYEGYFENGKANGKGTRYFDNGDKYVGDFRDDEMNGEGTCYYYNGAKIEGNWVDGLRDGPAKYYFPDGTWVKGHYVNDQADGIWVNERGEKVAKYSKGELIRKWD